MNAFFFFFFYGKNTKGFTWGAFRTYEKKNLNGK